MHVSRRHRCSLLVFTTLTLTHTRTHTYTHIILFFLAADTFQDATHAAAWLSRHSGAVRSEERFLGCMQASGAGLVPRRFCVSLCMICVYTHVCCVCMCASTHIVFVHDTADRIQTWKNLRFKGHWGAIPKQIITIELQTWKIQFANFIIGKIKILLCSR
jgi:hypothetical protein